MKYTTKYLVSLLLMLWSFSLFGQVFLEKEKVKIEKKVVSNEDLSTILNTVDKALKEYEAAAPLLDKKTLEVTENSIQSFESLFDNSAKVLNDLRGKSHSLINYSDYASYAYNYLKSGILTKLTNAKLVSITKDGNSYQAGVIINKEMRNGIDAKKQPVLWSKPVVLELMVIYDIQEDNLGKAKISKIGRYMKPKKDKKFFIVPSGRFGFNFYNVTTPDLDLDFGNNYNTSLGLQLGYNINDKLSIVAGIFKQLGHNLKSSEKRIPPFTNENADVSILKDNDPKDLPNALKTSTTWEDLKESIDIESLEFIGGIRYYTGYETDKLRFFGEAVIIFEQFKISTSGATGSKFQTAELDYSKFPGGSGSLPSEVLENTSYASNVPISINGISVKYEETNFLGKISGGVLYSFTDNIGLEAALEYSVGGFGKAILTNTQIVDFETENPEGSFIEEINKNGSLGARLGLNISF